MCSTCRTLATGSCCGCCWSKSRKNSFASATVIWWWCCSGICENKVESVKFVVLDIANITPQKEEVTVLSGQRLLPGYEAILRVPWLRRRARGAVAPPKSRAVCPRNWELALVEVAAVAVLPAWTLP